MQEKSTAKEKQAAEECKEALQTTAKQQEHTIIQEQNKQKHTVYTIYIKYYYYFIYYNIYYLKKK